jgi:hypothetical protein
MTDRGGVRVTMAAECVGTTPGNFGNNIGTTETVRELGDSVGRGIAMDLDTCANER